MEDVFLRVDYVNALPDYMTGYVYGGCLYWHNALTESKGLICRIDHIGKGCIEAVYFIDPKEILL